MSFSAEWLALREPADHAARDTGLLSAAGQVLKGRPSPLIVDLGCGTGSNLRALAPHAPADARIRLVDRDPGLLKHAREAAERHGAETVEADLAGDLVPLLSNADLVTGSALLDLCSAEWLDRLICAAPDNAIHYYALSYDGREHRAPQSPRDRGVHAAFLRHQQRDKGLGPALGPMAAIHLAAALTAKGYTVQTARSDWRLTSDSHGNLIEVLDDGIAHAAAEEGADVAEWRKTSRTDVVIGHVDLLALPPEA